MMQDSEQYMNFNLKTVMLGIAAGVAAAILSLSSVVQNTLSFFLFILSPLPVLLAGVGWGPVAGVISVIVCGLSIFIFAGKFLALIIIATTAIPAALAAYCAGMARPDDAQPQWYPLGLILLLTALAVATGFVVSGVTIDYNSAFIEEFSKEFIKQISSTNPDIAANPAALKDFVTLLMASIPFILPACWLMIMMANLWLAIAITRRSGLLNRPQDNWPDALHLPFAAVPLLVLAVIGTFLSNSFGSAVAAFAGGLGMAFTITGFAFVHAKTRGKSWRPAALWLCYVATLTFGAAPIFLFAGLYRTAKNSAPGGS
jgi:Predicted membrane protein (DUF2232)